MTKFALVTGAGSGIGRAVALKLAANEYNVVVAGRRAAALADTVKHATGSAGNAHAIVTDVADPAAVDAMFEEIAREFGRLDLVFNNAGTNAPGGTIDELTVEDWLRVIATNLSGTFLVARGAFAQMRRQSPQGGRIINNGSISAQAPRPGSVAYTASKHGVTGLTRSLSLDGRAFDIACGQIDIGNAATEMAAQIAIGVKQADGSVRPEPTIDPDHVADAVLYMAGLPLSANVQFMTVMATKMPLVGRG